MKTADFSKLFLAIMMVYIFFTFCDRSMSLTLHSQTKNSPKKPNQKWAKCCMRAPIRQVFLKSSLFIVHFSKIYLKTSSWNFL